MSLSPSPSVSVGLLRLFALCAGLAFAGCTPVTVDGVDNFSGQSGVWFVRTDGDTRVHELVLSSVAGACNKSARAYEAMRTAEEERRERDTAVCNDEGLPLECELLGLSCADCLSPSLKTCESEKTFLDDVARAWAPLRKNNASQVSIRLTRAGVLDPDVSSAPEAGTFQQTGGGDLGFLGSLVQYSGNPDQERADAVDCESGDDLLAMLGDGQEAAADVSDNYALDAGTAEISEQGDHWQVDLSADLLSGTDSIGSIETSFVARECEVEVNTLQLF